MDGRIVALLATIAIGTLPGWLLARSRTVESRARAGAGRRADRAELAARVGYVRGNSDTNAPRRTAPHPGTRGTRPRETTPLPHQK